MLVVENIAGERCDAGDEWTEIRIEKERYKEWWVLK